MEDMDCSLSLFRRSLSPLHETWESSPSISTTPCSTYDTTFASDKNAASQEAGAHKVETMLLDSEPLLGRNTILEQGEESDDDDSNYRTECQIKASSFCSRSRISAIKKRNKIAFEINNDIGTSGQKKRASRMLFTSPSSMDTNSALMPLQNIQFIDSASVPCRSQEAGKTTRMSNTLKRSISLQSELSLKAAAKFSKCHSDMEMRISSALGLSDGNHDLIGDFSRPFSLPVVNGKHQDLKAISHETMANILSGQCQDMISDFIIIDCRYPYEFEAGHIAGARNIYSKDDLINEFLISPQHDLQRHPVLIFHCEFSSERGPKLLRYLRNKDRDLHRENYPTLYYPEMYILEGGYKEFCQWHENLCDPRGYKPMAHKDHSSDLSHYRAKSKLYVTKVTTSSERKQPVWTSSTRRTRHLQKTTSMISSLRC